MWRPVLSGSKAPGDWWISSSLVRGQSNRRGANVRIRRAERRLWRYCPARLHAGSGQTLEILLAHRLHLGRCRWKAAEFRADAKARLDRTFDVSICSPGFRSTGRFDFIVVGKSPL